MKVTDYERIAEVHPTQLGQIQCPKCIGVCNERSPERRSPPRIRREWDCSRCGRGWIEVPDHVRTVKEALDVGESLYVFIVQDDNREILAVYWCRRDADARAKCEAVGDSGQEPTKHMYGEDWSWYAKREIFVTCQKIQ